MSNVFKAYDIRGVYPEDLNKGLAFKIGGATVKFLKAKTLVIGEDARISSPILRGAVIDAITRAGVKVYYIGPCTTPLFYFSVNQLKADGGIMITASHNPPQYGGLKIVGKESQPIGLGNGLEEIQKLSENSFETSGLVGVIEERNFISDYVDFVIEKSGLDGPSIKNFKLVIDAGNGMTPLVLGPLMEKLGISYAPLYFEIDCNFPNHSPDISKEESLGSLKEKIIKEKADLGVAFDGDGDRISFVGSEGERIRADYILALIFKSKTGFLKNPKAVYDLRFSKSVREFFGKSGIMSKVGRSNISNLMRKHDADLGAELAGHFFFKEAKYLESSVLTMLIVIKIMAETGKSISELVKPFKKYSYSGEINIPIASRERGLLAVDELKDKYKDGKIGELDGVTVEYGDWWFNLRLSNTEPIMRLVVEADTEVMMEEKRNELLKVIKNPL